MTRLSRLRSRGVAALPRLTSRRRFAILVASLFTAFAFGGAALATTFYYVGILGVNGYASTAGWNNRDYNRACRDDGFYGTMAVGYYNTSGSLAYYSGNVTTKCSNGYIARLENDGYFKCRCWNHDVGDFWVVCQTTP